MKNIVKTSLLILLADLTLLSCTGDNMMRKNEAESGSENWMLYPFVKHEKLYPLLKNDTVSFYCPVTRSNVRWQETYVFNPAAVLKDNKIYMIFRAEDKVGEFGGTSRLGIAVSNDGFSFTKYPDPVLYPDNDQFLDFEQNGGCEDPRIVESEDGTYIMTYTAFNGRLARLCVATSKDLFKWEKHGLAFGKAGNGIYADLWSKSGSIISRRVNEKIIATRINGKYWMYWGETDIYLATSENLIDWEPVLKEEKKGKLLTRYLGNGNYELHFDEPNRYFKTALEIREGRFDSGLVEPGPPALITPEGILFIYNASNDGQKGDTALLPNEYTSGQVLFDLKDPSAVINRCVTYFLRAEKDFETSGQMSNTAFTESLIYFNNKWFTYYVMAEAGIGVAVCDEQTAY